MFKIWKISGLAALLLVLTACGGTSTPGAPGGPGSDLDPESCRVVLKEPIRMDFHLENRGEGCDYRIAGGNADNLEVLAAVTADPGAVIMVNPGVRVLVRDGGSLNLRGEAGNPVSFIGTVPEHGSWEGFCFSANPGESWFDYVHIVWAGNNPAGTSAYQCRGAIGSFNDEVIVNITNSIIFGSKTTGIEATRMILGDFRDNRLSNHAEYGIRVSGDNVSRLDYDTDYVGSESVLAGGDPTPNGIERIYIWPGGGGVSSTSGVHDWKNLGTPYHIAAGSPAYTQTILQFGANTRVAIEEGTELLIGQNVALSVKPGAVVGLFGTNDNRVIIEGDTVDSEAGHWQGFNVENGALISNYAEIHHGGRDVGTAGFRGTIGFSGIASLRPCSSISNTLIAESGSYGVQIGSPYTDDVHLGDNVTFEGIASENEVIGTAAGTPVSTFDEALACM